jgi:hypothetical protein
MAMSLQAAIHAVFDHLKQRNIKLPDGIERQFIQDDANGHYQLLHIGWDGLKAVRNILVHIDIKADLVWVQCDYTDYQIVDLLLEQGLTEKQIVLAFHAPYKRQYTGFALG